MVITVTTYGRFWITFHHHHKKTKKKTHQLTDTLCDWIFHCPFICCCFLAYPPTLIDLSETYLNQPLCFLSIFVSLFILFQDGQQIWELEATVDKDKSQAVSTVIAIT